MSIELDFHGGKTRLHLGDTLNIEELSRPKKVRRRLRQLRRALGLTDDMRLLVVVTTVPESKPNPDPSPEPEAVELRTMADLLKFVFTFTGSPRSSLNSSNTVKDLINQLNANGYGNVSAAIHKIGPTLSQKIKGFLIDLDNRGDEDLPTEAKP